MPGLGRSRAAAAQARTRAPGRPVSPAVPPARGADGHRHFRRGEVSVVYSRPWSTSGTFSPSTLGDSQGTGSGFIWDERPHRHQLPRHRRSRELPGHPVGPDKMEGRARGAAADRDLAVLRIRAAGRSSGRSVSAALRLRSARRSLPSQPFGLDQPDHGRHQRARPGDRVRDTPPIKGSSRRTPPSTRVIGRPAAGHAGGHRRQHAIYSPRGRAPASGSPSRSTSSTASFPGHPLRKGHRPGLDIELAEITRRVRSALRRGVSCERRPRQLGSGCGHPTHAYDSTATSCWEIDRGDRRPESQLDQRLL